MLLTYPMVPTLPHAFALQAQFNTHVAQTNLERINCGISYETYCLKQLAYRMLVRLLCANTC